MTNLVIRGTLTTTGLTHQTAPGGQGEQIKTAVATPEGLLRDVPYITSNSVRGLIRRAAADLLLEKLAQSKGQIHRNLYLSIVRGSYARTGVDAGGASYEKQLAAFSHVFAGLFGGGAYMYRSPWRIERDLLPVLEAYKGNFPFEVQARALNATPWQIITKTVLAPRDDFAQLPSMARQVVGDLQNSYNEHMGTKIEQSTASKVAKEAGEKTKKDDLNNFAETECIIPGVPLYLGMTATNVTPAQAGLLLLGLNRWVNRNALGGGSARGRGAFIPNLSLSIDGELVVDHLLVGDAPDVQLAQDPRVQQLVEACNAEIISAATPESLANVYPIELGKDTKEKKTKKAKTADTAASEA